MKVINEYPYLDFDQIMNEFKKFFEIDNHICIELKYKILLYVDIYVKVLVVVVNIDCLRNLIIHSLMRI
jgi:hypothetical protein